MNSMNMQFGPTLVQLVIQRGYVRKNHSPDWMNFVAVVPDVEYETLRKAIAEERPVSETLLRRVAAALNVEPTVFTEYRLIQARRALDPKEVGWSRAVEALQAWERAIRPV